MQSRFRSAVDLVAGIAMIATAGVVLWAKLATPPPPPPPQPPPPPPGDAVPAEPQSLAGAQVKGSPNARIGIIEYADFECPACGSFVQRTYGDLVAKYVDTGKVRLFFRHFPLPNHQFARSAAVGAHCAGEQGKFWDLYERVFTLQPRLDDAGLRAAARKAGVEPSAWSRCIASDGAGDVVDADFEAGRAIALRGTPGFLVGTIQENGTLRVTSRLHGAQGLSAFEKAIADAEK